MNDVVLDASVVLKWFLSARERGHEPATELRRQYESGRLRVAVPSLLFLEVLNVAGRRWGWDGPALEDLAAALGALGFDVREAELGAVAAWVARGLTAYDAAYVALAEELGAEVVSDDATMIHIAGGVARPLA